MWPLKHSEVQEKLVDGPLLATFQSFVHNVTLLIKRKGPVWDTPISHTL